MDHSHRLLSLLDLHGGILEGLKVLGLDVAAVVIVQELAQLFELCCEHFCRTLLVRAAVIFCVARSSGRGSPAGAVPFWVFLFWLLMSCRQNLPSLRPEWPP